MEHSKEEELAMMAQPDRWPAWPRLPLKRRDRKPNLGYLLETSEVLAVVYLRNVFDDRAVDPGSEVPTMEYGSLEAMVDDGWVVD